MNKYNIIIVIIIIIVFLFLYKKEEKFINTCSCTHKTNNAIKNINNLYKDSNGKINLNNVDTNTKNCYN